MSDFDEEDSVENDYPIISLSICTRGRPIQFESCLRSLGALKDHRKYQFELIVIENNAPDYAQAVLEKVQPPFPYLVINVPKPGLSNARNAAIAAFLPQNRAWMGYIDDDEVIDPEWLNEMCNAMKFFEGTHAFAGPTFEIFPPDTRKYFARIYTTNKFGKPTKKCGAGNILLHRSIFDEAGLGLRFDPRLNASGGEDSALFQAMLERGEPVIWVPSAICHEEVSADNAKFTQRAKILIKAGNNETNLLFDRHGWLLGLVKTLKRMLFELTRAIGSCFALLLVSLFSSVKRTKYFEKMLRSLLLFSGCVLAIYAGRSTHYLPK